MAYRPLPPTWPEIVEEYGLDKYKKDEVGKVEQVDKVDQKDKVDNVEKVEKVENVEKVDKVDQVDKVEKKELSESSESDHEPPKNFPGFLMGNEVWMKCPYYEDYRYINLEGSWHLHYCRKMYGEMKMENKEEMDIEICRYDWRHHVQKQKLDKHELLCLSKNSLFGYLESLTMRRLHSYRRAKQERRRRLEEEKEKEEKGKEEKAKEGKEKEGIKKENKSDPAEPNEPAVVTVEPEIPPAAKGRGRGRILQLLR